MDSIIKLLENKDCAEAICKYFFEPLPRIERTTELEQSQAVIFDIDFWITNKDKLDKWHLVNFAPINEQILEMFTDEIFQPKQHPNLRDGGYNFLFSNPNITMTPNLLRKIYRAHLRFFKTGFSLKFFENKVITVELLEAVIELERKYQANKYFNSDRIAEIWSESFFRNRGSECNLTELLKYKKSSFFYTELLRNKKVKLSDKELVENKPRLNEDIVSFNEDFLTYPLINWNLELLSIFEDIIDFSILSKAENVLWSEVILYKYIYKWDWNLLSQNPSFCWSTEILEKYQTYWRWDRVSRLKNFPWTIEFLEKHVDKFCFDQLSNSFPLTKELIIKYQDKLDFSAVLRNPNAEIDSELIHHFRHRFDKFDRSMWKHGIIYYRTGKYDYDAAEISQILHLNISVETLKEMTTNWKTDYVHVNYSDNDDMPGEWVYFSRNENLTDEHIAAFEKKFDWDELSKNVYLKITPELLMKYKDRKNCGGWNWDILCGRPDFIYGFETLVLVHDKLNWDILLKNESFLKEIIIPRKNTLLNFLLFKEGFDKVGLRKLFTSNITFKSLTSN